MAEQVKLSEDCIAARKAAGVRLHQIAEQKRAATREERFKRRMDVLRRSDGVTFRHFRQFPRFTNKGGKKQRVQPAKGGICVAVKFTPHTRSLAIGVSVCSRHDTYDKLDAREKALDRLQGRNRPGDQLGTFDVFVSRGTLDKNLLNDIIWLTVRNAVNNLGNATDRRWMRREIVDL